MNIKLKNLVGDTLLRCCESIVRYLEESPRFGCNDLACQRSKRCCHGWIVAKVMYEKRS